MSVKAGPGPGQTFWVADDVMWWPARSAAGHEKVAVVTVSYNTRERTALLLWSLRTIVNWPDLEIVVVDNGSADGSAELLAEAAQSGICVLLANDVTASTAPVSTRESPGWPPDADRTPGGSGSWTPTSLPHSRTRCPQPWLSRGNAQRPWSVSRAGTHGTRSRASGCTRCLWTRPVSGNSRPGRSPTTAIRCSICSPRPHGLASPWRPSRSPPGVTSFTVAGAALPGSTPPVTARTPTTSGPRPP